MKKFFTDSPLQSKSGDLLMLRYTAVDNESLQIEEKISFPILTAIHAYVKPGEAFEVIAVMADTPKGKENYAEFCKQTEEICLAHGLQMPRMVLIAYEEDQRVGKMAALLLRIVDEIRDGDQLYACMTFGTKPVSAALLNAVQFGYWARENATIDCVVYGEIVRPSADTDTWFGRVYDETGLLQLGETLRLMAEAGVRDPGEAVKSFLGM